MKTKSILAVLLVIYAALWFNGCDNENNKSNTSVEFDTIVVQKQIPLIEVADSTLPFADFKINFIYPSKFGNDSSLIKLQQIFVQEFFGDSIDSSLSVINALNQYQTNYTKEYQSLSEYFESDKQKMDGKIPMWYWYFINLENIINFKNDSLLSFAVEYSDYTGGAHGSFNVKNVNVDLKKIKVIKEQDIFIADYKPILTEKILNRLMEKYNISTIDSLDTAGFIFPEGIAPNNNFWLDADSIHYEYNQYEIAPYYMGVTEVAIPYSDLNNILLPDGFLKWFINKEQKD
ncbi:MAG: DUF3298 domain-containing protein [Dysgonamonadaceae bacterium]|nr:DUF3298 domain-containing protein [Dysgonamonadaceae bacterium]MDD3309707.1 DUF3298 domain-containing protein [Dysgonamonadaceae bacterium]MDD3900776.1 DUF3298 domain-containing protein [Dysgonamonadaceae bacterium]MDD4399463.1 DUF3298 domain-containing protein [Dysgonamonadaceae bacterium]